MSNSADHESSIDQKVAGNDYLDYSDRDDILTGGIKMIPIATDVGEFKV